MRVLFIVSLCARSLNTSAICLFILYKLHVFFNRIYSLPVQHSNMDIFITSVFINKSFSTLHK